MTSARRDSDVANRKDLSKNVLQMKFMQKGIVVKVDKEEEMAKRIQRNKAHWVIGGTADEPKKLPYQFDKGIVECENLLPIGRMAFLGFNPVVEKVHKELLCNAKMKISTDREEYDEISDEEMAHRYETLIDTIDKKFQTKRKHGDERSSSDSDSESDEELRLLKKRAKRGFLKPKVE